MVEIRLLGVVELVSAGRQVPLGPAKQRSLLAAVTVDVGRPVPASVLIDRVWDDSTPVDARAALHTYVARVRAVLADAADPAGDGPPVGLERRAGGYQLVADPMAVDLNRFRAGVERARGLGPRDPRRAATLRAAIDLWRGDPLGEVAGSWAERVRQCLRQQRLDALADWADAELAEGRQQSVIEQLRDLVVEHPLAEKLTARLLQALEAAGRHPEALDVYTKARRWAIDEMGSEPGPALQALYQRILRHRSTEATPAGEPTRRHLRELAIPAPGGGARPTPAQLPADAGVFTGRTAELAALSEVLTDAAVSGRTVVISAIGGVGGIGKTRLAVRWAHRHRDQFPDGQLFVDLRGFDPADEPVSATVAVRGFLDALGVPAQAIPVDAAARVGLYRSLLAERRMLILLDNARDAAQVTDLIPGSGDSVVLITSRNQLTGLITSHSAQPVSVDVLDEAQARDLLACRLGVRRLAREPDAVRRLVAACGGLPLALSIVAARALLTPRVALSVMADELADAASRLRALDDDPQTGLSHALSSSYSTLTPAQAKAFALLGAAPVPDVSVSAAAALMELSVAEAGAVLTSLARQSLVEQPTPGRWRMHDLVRLYAAERAHQDFETDRRAGLRRLVDYCLHTAYHAERLLFPFRESMTLHAPVSRDGAHPLADEAAAWAWLDSEYPTLLAAQQLAVDQGSHDAVWQLAWSLNTFHTWRGHVHDFVAVWRTALASAQQLGSASVQALAHQRLGRGNGLLGREAEAVEHLDQATKLAELAGDLGTQAETQLTVGWLWHVRGDNERAIEQFTGALRLYRHLKNPIRECEVLNAIGFSSIELRRYAQARTFLDAALALARTHRYRFGEAVIRNSLGGLAHRIGEHAEALAHSKAAHLATRDTGNTYAEAMILKRMGEVLVAAGDPGQARQAWQRALHLCRTQHRNAEADRIEQQLQLLAETRSPFAGPSPRTRL